MAISAVALDTASQSILAVNTVIATETATYTGLSTNKSEVDAGVTSISALASKLSQLSRAADALSDPSGFYAWSATSTDPAVVAAVTTPPGSGVAHSFTVSVANLAAAQVTTSEARGSATQALGATGVLAIGIGATTTNVTVSAGDSLTDLAANINSSGARVFASVNFDADSGTYTLAVRGLDTGAANAFSLRETGEGREAGTHLISSLGLYRPSNTTQVAADASFTVDGVTRSSSTNQVTNAVPGVNLALTRATTATVTLSSDAILHTSVADFVSAYNDVITSGHASAGFGAQAAVVPELADDAAVNSSLDQISSLITTPVSGNTSAYTTLESVGLQQDGQTGLLSLNATLLDSAIANDPEGVKRLFVTDATTHAPGAMSIFHDTIAQLAGSPGSLLQARTDALASQSTALLASEAATQARIDNYRTVLHDLLTALAAQMAPPSP